MKKSILSLSVAFLLLSCATNHSEPKEAKIDTALEVSEPTFTRLDTITAMVKAFARQESNCNEHAVSPDGKYVGYLQISTIMVDEVNRLLGGEYFYYDSTYIDDRLDYGGSFEIFNVIMEYKNPTLNIDRAIDIWNSRCGKTYRANIKEYYQEELIKIYDTKKRME